MPIFSNKFPKKCCAPRPYSDNDICGRHFMAPTPQKLYCSTTCANRAHRAARKRNSFKAGAASPAANILQQVNHLEEFERQIEQAAPKESPYDLYFKQSKDPKPEDL